MLLLLDFLLPLEVGASVEDTNESCELLTVKNATDILFFNANYCIRHKLKEHITISIYILIYIYIFGGDLWKTRETQRNPSTPTHTARKEIASVVDGFNEPQTRKRERKEKGCAVS